MALNDVNLMGAQSFGKLEPFQPTMAWNNYKERMEFYFEANGIANETSMRAIFLSCVGEAPYEIIRSLLTPLTPKDVSLHEIVEKLEIVQRFAFHKRHQNSGETIADFVKDLRKLSEHCGFMELDNMLRDQIVCGVAEEALQKRLFSETRLDFKRAYEIAIAHEAAYRNVRDVRGNGNDVLAVSMKNKPRKVEKLQCFRCEGSHFANKCHFKDKKCEFCQIKGHSMKACFKKRAHDRKKLAVHALDGEAEDTGPAAEENNYFYELNTVQATSTKKILTGMYLNGVLESFEVDSGAAFTVISEITWNRINLGNRDLRPSNIMLQTWSEEKLNVLGSARVNVEYNRQKYVLSVLVIAGGGRFLLGRDWFDALGITVHGVLTVDVPTDLTMLEKKYNSVFNEHLGAHNGPAISLEIVQGAQPIFRKYRPCPIAWKPAVEREIEKLVAQKVLEPTLFSHWATPIVPVIKKDGTMRICGDYRSTVNAVIKPNTYPLPLFSEVKAEIAGAKLFTKLDLQQAYQQLVVDDFAAE
ncbi:PREDICTED: uncharacterized protein LOC108373355, partial [Rhagoletis zephyria]|uniref:uncharacterized protein LOC108373355 n=1 Tax=Rhagoletis zephyria TaxID=28612 RepID=UPI00081139C2